MGIAVTVAFQLLLLAQPPAVPVAVLSEDLGGPSPAAVAEAAHAQLVSLEGLASLDPHTLLVLPECRQFPAAGLPVVGDYVKRGGRLLAAGGAPFERLVFRSEEKWVTQPELFSGVEPKHSLVDWSKVDLKTPLRGTNQPQVPVKYTPVDNGYSAEFDMTEPIGWETITIPAVSPPAGENVLRLRASGGGKALALLIEVREKDGTRWMATLPVTSEERDYGLHRDAFVYWRDSMSKGRGGKDDRPNFGDIVSLSIGFASSHQTLSAGHYTYTVRNLATGSVTGDYSVPETPKLEGFCPAYKTFETTPVRYEYTKALEGADYVLSGSIVSPVARAMHQSDRRDYTWQPLIKGFNDKGEWIATPLSITWHRSGAAWAFCGFPADAARLADVVRRVAAVIASGPTYAETPQLLPADPAGECVKVVDGHFHLGGKRWFAHGINFWPLYVSGMEPVGYFSHWLSPEYYIPELIDQDLNTLDALGINLVSIQYTKPEELPQLYDFLTRCGKHGIKANLWLPGGHPVDPAGDDDLAQRDYFKLMRAANLAGNPNIFGYDLAWEPMLGQYPGRKKLDHLFEAWIVEQYGSVERAEEVWRCPVNRADGRVTAPSDDQVYRSGKTDRMVAAYRRFADDLISRRYREIVRIAKSIDDTHLFGARTGCGGTGSMWAVPMMQFQLTSGAAHLDFISPEGYGYGPANVADAVFVDRYARWAGNGKPVFWAEFGLSVWEGGESGLARQGEMYQAFADILSRSGSDGWAGWWYPGGYRVDERSDYGIIGPDRRIRPSAQVLMDTAPHFKEGTPAPAEGTLVIEPEPAPQGLARLVKEQSKEFTALYNAGKPLPEIRTRGTGTTSKDCPFTGLGGIRYQAPMPAEFVNAELHVIGPASPGGAVVVEIVNTGEATLLPEDCGLVVKSGKTTKQMALEKPLARYERCQMSFSHEGPCDLVMHSSRFGDFGERTGQGK